MCDYTLVEDQVPPLYTADPRISIGDPNLLQVVTYNVLNFQGFPGRKAQDFFSTADRLDFFEKVMRALEADIIVMQEVSSSLMVKALAERLSTNAGFTPGSEAGRSLGGAILTRYPIKEFVSFVKTKGKDGKAVFARHFWRATLTVRPALDIMVYGLHLWPACVDQEVKVVLDVLEKEKLSGVPQFLLGDFNLDCNISSDLSVINQFWQHGFYEAFVTKGRGKALTCTPSRPYSRVDYIFFERAWVENLLSVSVVTNQWTSPNSEPAIAASDHLPVRISCKIPELKEKGTRQQETNENFGFTLDGTTYLMKWIPPGEFMMGSEYSWNYYMEMPVHKVKISQGFWMLEHEVTQKLWKSVLGNNPSYFKGNERHPVEQVSWNDCQDFLRKLSENIPGKLFRLPTEAEWEYACRAGGSGNSNGEDNSILHTLAWYDENSKGTPRSVKGKKPNAWGLYDMLGNVWEWCEDDYVEKAYLRHSKNDPITYDGNVNDHVLRGGSWFDEHWPVRSSCRFGRYSDYRNFAVGLRFVLSPP